MTASWHSNENGIKIWRRKMCEKKRSKESPMVRQRKRERKTHARTPM